MNDNDLLTGTLRDSSHVIDYLSVATEKSRIDAVFAREDVLKNEMDGKFEPVFEKILVAVNRYPDEKYLEGQIGNVTISMLQNDYGDVFGTSFSTKLTHNVYKADISFTCWAENHITNPKTCHTDHYYGTVEQFSEMIADVTDGLKDSALEEILRPAPLPPSPWEQK